MFVFLLKGNHTRRLCFVCLNIITHEDCPDHAELMCAGVHQCGQGPAVSERIPRLGQDHEHDAVPHQNDWRHGRPPAGDSRALHRLVGRHGSWDYLEMVLFFPGLANVDDPLPQHMRPIKSKCCRHTKTLLFILCFRTACHCADLYEITAKEIDRIR